MSIINDIKDLKIQGARQIALESLRYLKIFSSKNGFGKKFDIECKKLLLARPTAVVLHNVIEELRKDKSARKTDFLINELLKAEEEIARIGKKIFKKNAVVMTHCHSHEVVAMLLASRKKIKRIYVTETRPKYQGIITAKELSKKIPTTLIIDSAVGYYMNDTDVVIVGCDAIRKEGVVNKIGTLPLAITAAEYRKTFYVVGDTLKIDRRENIIIEKRKPDEIVKPMKNTKIENPAFDITPWRYVTGIVTERGILKPQQIKKMI